MNIAYLTCESMLPGPKRQRPDGFEHDQMMDALTPHFDTVHAIPWNHTADWSQFDAVIIGTTWDYWERQQAFLDVLTTIEGQTRLLNPAQLVRWNLHKGYLRQLANQGVPIIDTEWLTSPTGDQIRSIMKRMGWQQAVIKRQIGAGAHHQRLLDLRKPIADYPFEAMLQPYVQSIETQGERSFVVIDGQLSHGIRKLPAAGDYRIQSPYGGTKEAYTASLADRQFVDLVMGCLPNTPLYARVDVVQYQGQPTLIELELVEPFLYPVQGPKLGQRLAEALHQRLVQQETP